MKIDTLVLGGLQTNCYLVWNEEDGRGVIVDPADEALRISSRLHTLSVRPEAIFLTHGHFDHILAVNRLREEFHIPVYACEKETELLANPTDNLSGLWAEPFRANADVLVTDCQELTAAGMEFRVLHTPGHTKGSVCYYAEKEKVLFAGDTLFHESYGRTDFPGGSFFELLHSVRERLFVLPDDVAVYPGHGEETAIGYEKLYNPLAESGRGDR